MTVRRVMGVVVWAVGLSLALTAAPAFARPMWIGDCWGIGLGSKVGREFLERSNISYVQLLARVEYMEGDIDKAFANPRHRPWPWFDPKRRESLDSLIRKAAALGLKVELNLDPGRTAVSPAFRQRLASGERSPDEGSAWLFPDRESGLTDRQIALYADLFARAAAHCEKTYPDVVRWMQVGNDLAFPLDNYRKLVEAVVSEVKKRDLAIAVIANAYDGRLGREMQSGKLPDILGFHHLPAFAPPGSKYPSQAEIVLELRRCLSGKRSYRGRPVEIWADKWNPYQHGESMRTFEVWRRVVDRLDEQQRLGISGSGLITVFLDLRHTNPAAAWALSWNDRVTSPGFDDIARKIAELTRPPAPPVSASGAKPNDRHSH